MVVLIYVSLIGFKDFSGEVDASAFRRTSGFTNMFNMLGIVVTYC